MQTGRKQGMQSLNDELLRLAKSGVVRPRDAYMKAIDKEDIAKRLAEAGLQWENRKPRLASAPSEPDSEVLKLAARYRQELEDTPDNQEIMNNLAWILATHSSAQVRNGREALQLARRACDLCKGKDPAVIDTVAAALAENGLFEKAAEAAAAGVRLALEAGNRRLAEQIRAREDAYRRGEPARSHDLTPAPAPPLEMAG
jgi:hypothetical protein